MENISVIKLLASKNFITVNKTLIKKLGVYEAILLGEFASEFSYWEEIEKLEDCYFFSTVENIENNTGINAYHQREAVKRLCNLGLIETKKVGLPAKRYIKLNIDNIVKILDKDKINNTILSDLKNKDKTSNNLSTSSLNFKELDIKNFNNNNNNINNNNNNNINELFDIFYKKYPIKKSKKAALKVFTKVIKTVKFEDIMSGLENYIKDIKKKNTAPEYIKHPSTWLNQECWNDEYEQIQQTQQDYCNKEGDININVYNPGM